MPESLELFKEKVGERVIQYREAVEKGYQFYFNGEPCVKGHLSHRRTNDRNCITCKEDKERIRNERLRIERNSPPKKGKAELENLDHILAERDKILSKDVQVWVYRLMSPKEARAEGFTTYFTGKPCKYGHVDIRVLASFTCKTCADAGRKVQIKLWSEKATKEQKQARYEVSKTYNLKPRTPEQRKRILERVTKWAKDNPGRALLNKSLYKNQVKRATPKWLTEEHKQQMRTIYDVCCIVKKQLDVPHEVDHIIPLRGKIVCGLNVPWNLQILPKRVNNSKSNKFEGVFQ